MGKLKVEPDPQVRELLRSYPPRVRKQLLGLRKLILETAKELPEVEELQETLKWGEASYLTPLGSTLRLDWKKKNPNQYCLYFKCTSKLVPTFKKIFRRKFEYQGTRAIVFELNSPLPKRDLKRCIAAALKYHLVKNLPRLGMD